ncbi:MAG: helix-turn-helix domain-containing protein [Methylobacter sp.]
MKLETVAELQEQIKQMKLDLRQHERQLEALKNSLLPSIHNRTPRPIDLGHASNDKREAKEVRILAGRLKEARELCAHTVAVASQLLGVSREDLLRVESGVDIGRIPLWLIRRSAEVYNVPSDYLFGLCDNFDGDDPEAFRERDFLAIMQRLHIENYRVVVNEQIKLDNRLKALNTAVTSFGIAVQRINEVFERFTSLNPEFEDMPASAPVLRQINIAEELGQHAACVLKRYKCLPENIAAHGDQLDEVFPSNKDFPG